MGDAEARLEIPWNLQAPATDPRERIIEGASRCLAALGLERTSLSAIAREARVSRQTIYNHFDSKQEIIERALAGAASNAAERIIAAARSNTSAAGFVVELCVSALREYTRNPAISPVIAIVQGVDARQSVLRPEGLAVARHFIEPVLEYLPDRAHELDEMTETLLRFTLSLLTLESETSRSPDALRRYLHRVLVPAMGLPPDPNYRAN